MTIDRTTIHKAEDDYSGDLHVDYDSERYASSVYLHMSAGGFSHCLSLTSQNARKMAEALLKGAYAIEAHEASKPQEPPA